MSKKKQQRNGFFYYMLDMQQDFKANGRIVPMRDMPIFAGPSWSKLSDAQKHRYNTRAKSNKDSGGGGGGQEGLPAAASMVDTAAAGRRDCSGSLISAIPDVEGEKFQRRAREFEAIGTLLPAGKRATLEDIWLIDVQSLCHIPHKEDCKYLPCELGVVRYSLNQGIKSKFHRFIRPGQIPIGYRYLAQSTSDSTNKLPVDGLPEAVGDYRKLLGELEQYLTSGGAAHNCPPVYAKRECVDRVEWSLQWLADNAGVTNRITRVYELENLIGQLIQHSDFQKSVSPFAVEEALKTSNYEHDSGTRCTYHEELDCVHCSLGISHTYCYVLSELLCPIFQISMTRHHLPAVTPAALMQSKKVVYTAPGGVGRGSAVGRGSSRGGSNMGRGIGRGIGRGVASPELRQPLILGRGQLYPDRNP